MVLLPGAMMTAASWVRAGYVEALATRHRVIAVDPLGHGESDRPRDPEAYSGAGHSADILAVLEAEGVRAAHLWGYSRGGRLVLRFAAAYRERTLRVVAGGFPPTPASEEQRRLWRSLTAALEEGDERALLGLMLMADSPASRAVLAANDYLALAASYRAEIAEDGGVDYAAIQAPRLHYFGERDPERSAGEPAAAAQGAAVHVLPSRGHSGAFQASAEALALVEPWLEGPG